MMLLIGLGVALVTGWVALKLGTLLRERQGITLGKYPAIGAGVALALVIWLLLRATLTLSDDILNAVAIGPGAGLGYALYNPKL